MARTNILISLFTTACVGVAAFDLQAQGTYQQAWGYFDSDMLVNDNVSISVGDGRRTERRPTLTISHYDNALPYSFRILEFEDIEIDILDDFSSTRLHFAVNWRDIDGIEANDFVYFGEGKDSGFWIVSKWIDYEVEEVHAYKLSMLPDNDFYITEYINAFSFLGENGETEKSTFSFDFQTKRCSGQGASSEHYSEKEVPFEISGIADCQPVKVTDGFDFTVGFPDCDCKELDAVDEEEQDFSQVASATPPALSIQTGSISLSSDDILVANSSEVVRFVLENTGGGLAENLICKTVTSGDDAGINIPSQIEITPIAAGQSQEVRIPVETNADTQDGIARIRVEVIEPRGFSPSPFSMEVPIEAFRAPALEVTDFATKSTIWQPNTPIAVDVLIQNIGRGDAREVNAELSLSDGVVCFSGNHNEYIGSLAKGEVHKLRYDLMVPRTYAGSNVTFSVTLSEKMGQFGSSWNQTFPFEGEKNETVVVVQGGQRGSTKESGVVRATLGTATNESGEVIFSRTNSSRDVQAIAVIPKDGENCSGRTISGDDLAVFGETAMLGLYTVVDRKFFEQTLEEIKLSMTGLTFENGVLEAGCIENAQGYLFVEHGCLQNQETIKAKLIHCESSEIIWNGLGQGTSAKETFEEIVSRLNQE